ncbi:LuxR C-terminal-related transcriptional regulator [Streptomyces sp. NPDC015125]|uniref:helix-turn-helix transcriptional regulator n=1 Tax=Streptomyces sp. NPDC015125 TaxID=3364938 RepID=UPI0036F8AD98
MTFHQMAAYEIPYAVWESDGPAGGKGPLTAPDLTPPDLADPQAGDAEGAVTRLLSAHRKVVADQSRLLEALESALGELVRSSLSRTDCASLEAEQCAVGCFAMDPLVAAKGEVLLCLDPADLEQERFSYLLECVHGASLRGVTTRCICAESMVNLPGGQSYLQELQAAGAEIRVAPLLPFRLMLVDRMFAYVSFVDCHGENSTLEIRSPETCRFVHRVFDYCWVTRTSSKACETADAIDVSDREIIILRLLANGMKDVAMARSLGISTRTLRRVITDLMGKLGVSSRFQLGARAAECSLLW